LVENHDFCDRCRKNFFTLRSFHEVHRAERKNMITEGKISLIGRGIINVGFAVGALDVASNTKLTGATNL
jgi:hypothetical protein